MSEGVEDSFWIDPNQATSEGLVGVGGDLSPKTLLHAYRTGVFPWFNEGDPIFWWSPNPRAIFELDHIHCSRSLLKTLRSGKFKTSRNQCFESVMRACGETRSQGTWITEEMIRAYVRLHEMKYAHSLETWVRSDEDPETWELAGGIYGVAIGSFFAAESMFHLVTDASKVALVLLMEHLRTRGFTLVDTQMRTDHTTSMGAIDIPRATYLARLQKAVSRTTVTFE